MTAPVQIVGADRFARTVRDAGRELERLTATNQRVADGIAAVANPPRLTGRLASSITATATATTAVVTATAPYAVFVEARTGFMADALSSRTGASIDLYADAVDDALAGIKGV